jgi:hypothetical protein
MSETAHDPKHLLEIIDKQNQMIEQLLAENDQFRASGLELDAHSCLKAVYTNQKASETTRVKAAAAAIPYELPKKGSTNLVVVDFRERVRQARLKAPLVEPKTIEHQPDPVA